MSDIISENSDLFEELIFTRMKNVDELKNRLPKDDNMKDVEFVDKSLFKRVFSDITDIYIDDSTLNVCFERGIKMRVESPFTDSHPDSNQLNREYYKIFKIIGELIELKELTIKTSPFIVKLSSNTLKAVYNKSLDQKLYQLETVRNSHDDGINCWGGWGGPIRSSYNDFAIEDTLMLIIQRMEQLNIDDYAGNVVRMGKLINDSYNGEPININPMILAKLMIEYSIEKSILNGTSENIGSGLNNRLIIFNKIKTNIDYDLFRKLLKEMKHEFTGAGVKVNKTPTPVAPREETYSTPSNRGTTSRGGTTGIWTTTSAHGDGDGDW